jgi:hypothetical protein
MQHALCAALAAAVCFSADDTVFANGFDTKHDVVEFVMNQNLSSNTVICETYLAVWDFSQAGSITGMGCKATGELLPTDGTLGNIRISFTFTDGSLWEWEGCRIDDTSAFPGYVKIGINCT